MRLKPYQVRGMALELDYNLIVGSDTFGDDKKGCLLGLLYSYYYGERRDRWREHIIKRISGRSKMSQEYLRYLEVGYEGWRHSRFQWLNKGYRDGKAIRQAVLANRN